MRLLAAPLALLSHPIARAKSVFLSPHPLLRCTAAGVAVGRRYLTAYPDAPLERVLGPAYIGARDGVKTFRKSVQTQVRHDFSQGNVVIVDGWVLSRTEACVCGLVAKQARKRSS